MTWTDERVEQARKLWQDGWSATRIADELGGGITRNAVLSKIHRSGFAARPVTATPTVATRSKFDPRPFAVAAARLAPAPRRPPIADDFNIPQDPSTNCTLFELQADSCRWPIGDPSTPEFCFCGGKREHPTPYCTGHANLAYNVRKEQRRHLTATAFDPPDEREAA